MEAISKELALQEVEKWLDFKKVSANKRESYKDNIDSIANSISDGILVLNEDFTITQNLLFPFGVERKIEKLSYKPRLTTGQVYNHMQGIKASDVDGRLQAYICALTGSVKEIVKQLDTEDNAVAQNIAIFFL